MRRRASEMIPPRAATTEVKQGGEGPGSPGPEGRRLFYFSLALFAIFLGYYFITSSLLPFGAGPDYATNNDAVRFIYTNHRLAVIPKDEHRLKYSVYGDTRAVRPPLSYIVSAIVAGALHRWVHPSYILFRKGSALLGAATVAIAFYAAALYFRSSVAGLMTALLFGLLPQFAFISSYNNDDSGAIFSATLMLCVLVRILRRGTNWPNVVLLGIASGLVILSKPTAWLLAPTVLIFLILYLRAPWKKLARYAPTALVLLILAGGWWILFNMYHYGPGDPLVAKTEAGLEARHSRFPPGRKFGYAPRGVRYTDLLLHDYDYFWQKTVASTIGNLDWLRLRFGPLQYGLYLALFLLGFAYALLRILALIYRGVTSQGRSEETREMVFETVLVFAILFQLAAYVWDNMYNDIQLQGRYLLPVFLAAAMLGISAVRVVIGRLAPILADPEPSLVSIDGRFLQRASIVGTVLALVGVHVDGLVNYVVPFYRPPVYPIRLHRGFEPIAIPREAVVRRHEMRNFSITGTGFSLESEGTDPWFVVSLASRRMCNLFQGENLLKARIRAGQRSSFKIYVNKGPGFNEKNSYEVRYPAGSSDLVLVFDVPICSELRFDPAVTATSVEVSGLSLGKIDIGR